MDLDILILDEIGKNISGAGMDTKVVNRSVLGEYNPWPDTPRIERIFVRDLSDLTYNNAVGVGMADIVTDRLVNRIDWEPTRVNSLTASTPAAIRMPIHFPTDRECLEAIAPTVGKFDLAKSPSAGFAIRMELSQLTMSENLRPAIERNPMLEIVSAAQEIRFDSAGNLAHLAAESLVETPAAVKYTAACIFIGSPRHYAGINRMPGSRWSKPEIDSLIDQIVHLHQPLPESRFPARRGRPSTISARGCNAPAF